MTAREGLYWSISPELNGPGANELINGYRAEVLAEADDRLAAMTMPEDLQHTINAATYRHAWLACRAVVQAGKDIGDGTQPPADESTQTAPDFFQPGRTYQRGRWLFQCLAVAPNPFNRETRAVGYLYRPGEPATATALDPDDWERGGWTEATVDGAS